MKDKKLINKCKREIKARILEAGCKVRKDSVTMVETLITASPVFFEGKKPREIIDFFEYALEFMKGR